jgi:Family of unknown function (DUF5372)
LAWTDPSIAAGRELEQQTFRVTHPFHPLFGREFVLVVHKNNWAEDRVFFFADDGQMTSLPARWTDVGPPDPFVVLAAGRSAFRFADLVALADLLDGLRGSGHRRGVKKITPKRKVHYAAQVGHGN